MVRGQHRSSHQSATSGSDATCVTVAGQYKIATATGAQTYNVTAVGAEWLCQCIVLQATPEPAITQAAYRFYDEAGTESGATALAAQDTAITADLDAGVGYGHAPCPTAVHDRRRRFSSMTSSPVREERQRHLDTPPPVVRQPLDQLLGCPTQVTTRHY